MLLLQNGKWNNEVIIDSAWIARATHSPSGMQNCYLFWGTTFRNQYIILATGHGIQTIYVAPTKNLVVITTAWPYIKGNDKYQDNPVSLCNYIFDSCN
jgi:hypothetical protein